MKDTGSFVNHLNETQGDEDTANCYNGKDLDDRKAIVNSCKNIEEVNGYFSLKMVALAEERQSQVSQAVADGGDEEEVQMINDHHRHQMAELEEQVEFVLQVFRERGGFSESAPSSPSPEASTSNNEVSTSNIGDSEAAISEVATSEKTEPQNNPEESATEHKESSRFLQDSSDVTQTDFDSADYYDD